MFLIKSHIYKLFVMTLVLCSLSFSPAFAGRLPKSQTKFNNSEVLTTVTAEVLETKAATAAALNETENRPTKREENDDTANYEKNALQPAADTSLSVWDIVSGLWKWIREDMNDILFGDDSKTSAIGEGRTFGKIRRLQMALIPIVFKFGVLSAMVTFLVALGIKTLFLVKILVVMNLLALLAKFFTLKTNFGHYEHDVGHQAPAWKWSPYVTNGWHSIPEEHHHSNKEIHLHIHGGQLQPQVSTYSYGNGGIGQSQGWERRYDPYNVYETTSLQGQQNDLVANEITNTVNTVAHPTTNVQQFTSNFPENHRML